MGCFSYICSKCDKNIKSDAFTGEHCQMFLLQDGKVKEKLEGYYNSYGRTFEQDWSVMDWQDIVTLHFNSNDGDGISAFHTDCYDVDGDGLPEVISDDDPDQGCGYYDD